MEKDLEKALQEFASSDQQLRQMRENVDLELTIRIPEEADGRTCPASAKNLSKGGVGAIVSPDDADFLDRLEVGSEVILELRWPREEAQPEEEETDPLTLKAKVAWLNPGEEPRFVGCEFTALPEEVAGRVERHIMSQIIRRNIDEEE